MKRIAVVIGIVIGVAATPAVVAADSHRQPQRDRYELSRDWDSPLGPALWANRSCAVYLRFLREVGARHVPG